MSDHQDDPQTAVHALAEVNPFEWLKAHPWPRERPAGPRPILTPEEHTEAPLSAEDRVRRAELLARVREANHPRR